MDKSEPDLASLWIGILIGLVSGILVMSILELGATTGDERILNDGTRIIQLCEADDSWRWCDDWYQVEGPVSLQVAS